MVKSIHFWGNTNLTRFTKSFVSFSIKSCWVLFKSFKWVKRIFIRKRGLKRGIEKGVKWTWGEITRWSFLKPPFLLQCKRLYSFCKRGGLEMKLRGSWDDLLLGATALASQRGLPCRPVRPEWTFFQRMRINKGYVLLLPFPLFDLRKQIPAGGARTGWRWRGV